MDGAVGSDVARSYAQALYTATDAYLVPDTDLDRTLDLSMVGFGMQPVRFVLNLVLLNVYRDCGEISCLKGLNGLQGYPA